MQDRLYSQLRLLQLQVLVVHQQFNRVQTEVIVIESLEKCDRDLLCLTQGRQNVMLEWDEA